MKKTVLFFLCALLALALQVTFLYFPTPILRFDLILLLTFYSSFRFPLLRGGVAVLLMGLAVEGLGGGPQGSLTLSYLVVFASLHLLQDRFLLEGGVQIFWVFLFTWIQKGILFLFLSEPFSFFTLVSFGTQGILQTAGAFLLFPRLERWVRFVEEGEHA